MSALVTHCTACRSCGTTDLEVILSLGDTPLANALLTASDLGRPELVFPLGLYYCSACALVQVTHSISADIIFRHYLYLSSVSDEMVRHARDIAQRLISQRNLNGNSRVVELASND